MQVFRDREQARAQAMLEMQTHFDYFKKSKAQSKKEVANAISVALAKQKCSIEAHGTFCPINDLHDSYCDPVSWEKINVEIKEHGRLHELAGYHDTANYDDIHSWYGAGTCYNRDIDLRRKWREVRRNSESTVMKVIIEVEAQGQIDYGRDDIYEETVRDTATWHDFVVILIEVQCERFANVQAPRLTKAAKAAHKAISEHRSGHAPEYICEVYCRNTSY